MSASILQLPTGVTHTEGPELLPCPVATHMFQGSLQPGHAEDCDPGRHA